MAANSRRKLPAVIKDIIDNGKQYNFMQLMHLLEQNWLPCKISAANVTRHIKLAPAKGINFPANNINKCTINEDNRINIQPTFMGLCGVDSPLPHYFLELIYQDSDNSDSIYDFLNIFNNRLYTLLYLVWKKYHPFIQLKQSNYENYLTSLSGSLLTSKDKTEFAFAGLLGAKSHNSATLSGLLSAYLNSEVKINQFAPYWLNLGKTLALTTDEIIIGDNSIIGSAIPTSTKKINIRIGPITMEKARTLLPQQLMHNRLKELISRYVGANIVCDITLIVFANNLNCLILGKSDIQLNWSSWLGYLSEKTYTIDI